jgi:hypothetical protein
MSLPRRGPLGSPQKSVDSLLPGPDNANAPAVSRRSLRRRPRLRAARTNGYHGDPTVRDIILCGIVLSVGCTSAGCRQKPAAPAPGKTEGVETAEAGSGLQITPLGTGFNEMADILGVQMWRFHIVCNAPHAQVLHSIALRKEGQRAKEIACGITQWFRDDTDRQMVVALVPLDGDLHTSERLKTYVRVGGATFSQIGDNPLRGRRGVTKLALATRQPDGGFLLLQSSADAGDPRENNAELILTIRLADAAES